MPDIEPSIIPDSLAGIYARYRSIAPDPDPESPDVTAQLARHLAVTGLRRMALAQAKFSPRDVEAACTAMAAVRLLVRLKSAGDATPIARHIAVAWADGGEVEEWLHASALGLGLNPDELTSSPA